MNRILYQTVCGLFCVGLSAGCSGNKSAMELSKVTGTNLGSLSRSLDKVVKNNKARTDRRAANISLMAGRVSGDRANLDRKMEIEKASTGDASGILKRHKKLIEFLGKVEKTEIDSNQAAIAKKADILSRQAEIAVPTKNYTELATALLKLAKEEGILDAAESYLKLGQAIAKEFKNASEAEK